MNATTKRIARTIAIAAASVAAVIGIGLSTGVIHTYSGQNAGVTVGVGCSGVGFEYRGNVGVFTDLCQ